MAAAPGVPGVPDDDSAAAGGLVGFSFFFRGTLDPRGGPPGVPGNGCLRGLPRPLCGVGPGVTPGVPGVPGAPLAGALALLLLGGLDGVASKGVDGVPGIEVVAGRNGTEVGVPIGPTPGAIGIPLGPKDGTPDAPAKCGAEPYPTPGIEPYADGAPYWDAGTGKPLGPAWDADSCCGYAKLTPVGNG